MTLHGSEPAPDPESGARHRAAGRWRRLYALAVVLLLTGALGWQLWREPASDSAEPDDGAPAVRSAEVGSDTVHQRTVVTIVDPETIRVTEQLTFPTPTDEVTLVSPEHLGVAGDFDPSLADLWVDDGPLRQTATAPVPGEPVVVRLLRPTTEVTIGYLATGVVQPTSYSTTGRALALMTPLGVEGSAGLRAVEVRGVWVDNLGCVDDAGALTTCGTGTSLGWTTTPADTGLTDVVAQLTIPGGSA